MNQNPHTGPPTKLNNDQWQAYRYFPDGWSATRKRIDDFEVPL